MSNRPKPRGGRRVLYVPPDLPPSLGATYRNTTNLTGQCPGCDVETRVEVRDGVAHMVYLHDDTCPVMETIR